MSEAMQSRVGQAAVAAVPATDIGPFFVAPDASVVRLLVRNVGVTILFLAFDSSAVNQLVIDSQVFELPVGDEVVLILQPRQRIYAASMGGGGRVTYAASAALPLNPV